MKKIVFPIAIAVLMLGAYSCKKENPLVEIQTPKGKIIVEIFVEKAPITANNFLDHVEKGTYDGGCFYRSVRATNTNKVNITALQGGVARKEGVPRSEPIEHETTEMTGVRHEMGTISMARSKPGSASTEFFICPNAQFELDYGGLRNPDGQGFAAFGKVVDGMEVVHKIWGSPAIGEQLDPTILIHKIVVVK